LSDEPGKSEELPAVDAVEPPVRLVRRSRVGVPLLFAVAYSGVGFSIYFAIGVVADRGLGLTPLVFLIAGLLFALTTMTYVEGAAMFAERGGSSTFARHAFNELVAFVAGWAILIDYLILIALASLSVSHYLTPVSTHLDDNGIEIVVAGLVIALAAALNIRGSTGKRGERILVGLALGDLLLQLAVIVVGAIVVLHPDRLTAQLDLFTTPSLVDAVYAAVLATLAYAGIEATSNLAPDVEIAPGDLKRVIGVGALGVPLVYAGMAAIALMAVPVVAGPQGPHTELAGRFIEEPVLGVVSAFHPHWLSETMRWLVALVAAPVLVWAANTSMLGLSRHIYVLSTNRQIPSWLGILGRNRGTPHVAILASAVLAFALVLPTDVRFLAGIYAFGAMLTMTIAHLSILRLRVREPDRRRPFSVPLGLRFGAATLPLPTLIAVTMSGLAFISVIAFHAGARWVGGGWMLFGLVAYVIYRRLVEGTSLTKRVSVPSDALTKQAPDVEYASILVPIFGTELDDDIVATAGRLADAEDVGSGGGGPLLEVVYVIAVPLTLPLDAPLPRARVEAAERSLARAREVGEEYDSVRVHTAIIPARSVGAGIVEQARRRWVEAIVIGAEPPTRIRGGAVMGGIGGTRPQEIGDVTEYVLKKAPCRVLLTAPPESVVLEAEAEAAVAAGPGNGTPPPSQDAPAKPAEPTN
jgi:APA family basic amino acid/polyamine antiporter